MKSVTRLATVLAVFAVALGLPVRLAYATHVPSAVLISFSPRKSASKSGTTVMKLETGDFDDADGRGPLRTYYASNRTTKFLWDVTAEGDSSLRIIRVSRNGFASRLRAFLKLTNGDPPGADFSWKWKKIKGHRRRFITKIIAITEDM
jgi:hypothetical protein